MFDDLFEELFSEQTAFNGKGSYQKALDSGANFIYQTNPKADGTFYGFKTVEERDKMAKNHMNEGNEIVERVQGNTPASPYIDVDAPVDATDEDLNLITKMWQLKSMLLQMLLLIDVIDKIRGQFILLEMVIHYKMEWILNDFQRKLKVDYQNIFKAILIRQAVINHMD